MGDKDGHRLPGMTAGRQPAALALLGWLDDERAPRLCVITGSPGSGKSHLLAWLYAATRVDGTPGARRLHAFTPAAGSTLPGVTLHLARQLGVAARTPRELVAALAVDGRRTVITVADVHRAGVPGARDEARRIVTDLLDPLLALAHVRLIAEHAGPVTADTVTRVPAPAVLDLDTPHWTDRARFARWYDGLRAESPFDTPFSADDVHPHPGLARLAARVDGRAVTGPSGETEAPGTLAERTHRVHEAWWKSLPDKARTAMGVLCGLDTPLTDTQWEAVLDAVFPPPAHTGAPAEAVSMVPPVQRAILHLPTDTAGGRTWALRPADPLTGFIRGRLPRHLPDSTDPTDPTDPTRVNAVLRRTADGGATALAELYLLGEERISAVVDSTVRLGDAAGLAADPVVQCLARPESVVTALVATGQWDTAAGTAFRAAAPALIGLRSPAGRARLLRTHRIGRDDAGAERLTEYARAPGWRPRWAVWGDTGSTAHGGGGSNGTGRFPSEAWPGPVLAAAPGRGGFDGRVLLADDTGMIRTMDSADGTLTGRVVSKALRPLVSISATFGGRIVTLDRQGGVDVLDAGYFGPRGALEAGFQRLVDTCGAMPTVLCAYPRPAIGDAAGGVWWYGPAPGHHDDGPPPPGVIVSAPLHTGAVTALAAVRIGTDTGPTLLLSGGLDGQVRMWSPEAEPGEEPVDRRPCPVTAVACGRTPHGLMPVAAWSDGLVRIRRPEDGAVLDLNLGLPVTALVVTADGAVVCGTHRGVVGIAIDGT